MTEAEIAELVAAYWDIAVNSFTVYITFPFAYLAAAYFVGANLTRFQALTVSWMYIGCAASAIISMTAAMQAWSVYKTSATTKLDQVFLLRETFWLLYMPLLTLAGIVVSLYFMYELRLRAILSREN